MSIILYIELVIFVEGTDYNYFVNFFTSTSQWKFFLNIKVLKKCIFRRKNYATVNESLAEKCTDVQKVS